MLIELSYVLGESIPKWPTNPCERYDYNQSIQAGDMCNSSSVYHHMHNGTHVDAPRHFNPNGKTIDQLPIEDFYYTAPYVLHLQKGKGEIIEISDLKEKETELSQCDILLIYTGYSDLREQNPAEYTNDFPSFSPNAANYLRKSFPRLKAIAVDFLSVDSSVTASQAGFPVHHSFMDTNDEYPQRTLLLFEDVNVKKLLDKPRIQAICAFPIRFYSLEAAPVSMVAII